MFSTLLKELRVEKRLSQAQLAQSIGVSPGNVGDWEGGKSKPGYAALSALARFFEVSADYLLELDTALEKKGIDLAAMKRDQGLTCDGSPLSELEADLIAMFRLIPPSHQEELFDLTYFKYKRLVEREKESIFWTYADESANDESGPSGSHKAHDGTA